MSRRKTHEEFIKDCNITAPYLNILSKYKTYNDEITVLDTRCGHQYSCLPQRIYNGNACPYCMKNRKKTHDEFVEEMKSINNNIEFLTKYKSAKRTIICKCKIDGYEWESIPNRLLNGAGCPKCACNAKITKEEFFKRIKDNNYKYKNFEIIDDFIDLHTKIKCKCKKDGYTWYSTPRDLLYKNTGCPVCSNKVVLTSINDIETTHPHIVKFFKDTREAQKYTANSHKKTIFKCPNCGHEKECVVRGVVRYGFYCDVCDSKVSYPNRLSRALLLKLPVENLFFEYSPSWSNRKSYDNYFEYKNKKYILEMDGWWHYHDDWRSSNYSKTKEESNKIDLEKDKMAIEHNIKVIRIDCQKSNLEYIKNNILSSELSSIFDLSQIDWDECNCNAISSDSSLLNQIYYYHDNISHNTNDIANHFNKSVGTIYKYLKMGRISNRCLDFREENRIKNFYKNVKKVSAWDSENNYLGTFNSVRKCAEELTKKYGTKYYSSNIISCCTGKQNKYKNFTFKYT